MNRLTPHTGGAIPLPLIEGHLHEITDSEGFRGFESPVGGKGCLKDNLLTHSLARNSHRVNGYLPLPPPSV